MTIATGAIALLVTFTGGASAAQHGERDLSDGVIKSVVCRGRRLDMQLQTHEQLLHLYTANYFKVRFSAEGFQPKGTLNPCRDIRGMKAQAIFYDVPRRPNDGILISVELKGK